MDISNLNIDELHSLYAKRELTVAEVTKTSLDRGEELNGDLNAFLVFNRKEAMERAAALDAEIAAGRPLGLLTGVPVAVKDNICTIGLRTTAGSKILGNYQPIYNATVVEKLNAAGAVIIGKTNCDEFAMGSSNENSAFGPVRNPWNRDYVPGGSSGGSAVAVAANITPISLGSETGGSIRQPASMTGIVGLKTTYGRISRYGLIAFGSSLDQIGPFGRTVRDVARALGVTAGRDANDSTSSDIDVPDYLAALNGSVKGLRVGVAPEFFGQGIDPEVKSSVESAIKKLEELGATTVDISLPHTEYAIPVYYVLATAEASSNLARFDGVRYGFRAEEPTTLSDMYRRTRNLGFGTEVKRRIMLGTYVLSSGYYDAYYKKGQQVRSLIQQDYRNAFEKCDIIATPTAPTPAFRLGEKSDDPLSMYLSDIYTVTMNLAGVPGISVPCGLSKTGLPIGLQLIAKHFDEVTLLNAAHAYQQAAPLDRRPVL